MEMRSIQEIKKYRTVAVVESYEAARRVVEEVRAKRFDPEQLMILSLRHELIRPLQETHPGYRFRSIEEFEELEQASRRANRLVTSLGPEFIRRARASEFLWAILTQWHSEFLFHMQICFELAQQLAAVSSPGQTWILTEPREHNGARFGMFDNCGPVFNLVFFSALEKRRCRVVRSGPWSGDARAVIPLLWVRAMGNGLLFSWRLF